MKRHVCSWKIIETFVIHSIQSEALMLVKKICLRKEFFVFRHVFVRCLRRFVTYAKIWMFYANNLLRSLLCWSRANKLSELMSNWMVCLSPNYDFSVFPNDIVSELLSFVWRSSRYSFRLFCEAFSSSYILHNFPSV